MNIFDTIWPYVQPLRLLMNCMFLSVPLFTLTQSISPPQSPFKIFKITLNFKFLGGLSLQPPRAKLFKIQNKTDPIAPTRRGVLSDRIDLVRNEGAQIRRGAGAGWTAQDTFSNTTTFQLQQCLKICACINQGGQYMTHNCNYTDSMYCRFSGLAPKVH